jgi:aspartate dehydrogenase
VLRVGLIGLGAVGRQVAEGITTGRAGEVELCAILTRRPHMAPSTFRRGGEPQPVRTEWRTGEASCGRQSSVTPRLTDFGAFLSFRPAVVVEAASAEAVATYAEPILQVGASLIVASSSALVDTSLRSRLAAACRANGARVYVPAGALGGLDALAAAAVAGLAAATLRVVEPGVGSRRQHIFHGPALEAATAFPDRLNIAATAALATGADVTVSLEQSVGEVRIIELRARGPFGELFTQLRPEVRADQLSHIVALSLLATLRRLQEPFWIG